MAKHVRKDSLVWGFLLIIAGTIFLLDTLDVDIWDSVARFWPIALILWGGWKLYYGIKEKNEAGKDKKSVQD